MPRSNDFPPAPLARHLPAELLRQYVAGELSAAQEHGVEAHTLECEQCAEVLEGLEMQPAAATDASLTELRQRLRARVAELAEEPPVGPAVVPLWWRPLAAAAVLLLMLGAVAWLVLRPANRPELAANSAPTTKIAQPDETPAADFDGANASTESAIPAAPRPPDIAAVVPSRPPKSVLKTPAATSSARGEGAKPVSAEAAHVDVAVNMEAESVVETKEVAPALVGAPQADYATAKSAPVANQAAKNRRTTKLSEVALASPPASSRAALAATVAAEGGRTVRGRIVDSKGQPLPGVTVLAPGLGTGVSTSADGRFALTVPSGGRQLTVSSIGYTTQTRFVQATDSTLTLALAPDARQLSEVVVVRREAAPSLPSLGPLPAGGYATFRQYLRDSLAYPEKARERNQQGTVRLQFMVQADGKLSDIKIVRRVSPECDEEAIRLLKEGPAWFPSVQNGRRTARKVEINVPFSLEK